MTQYQTRIGHAHLKVRQLQRAIDFYTRYFNLHLTEQVGQHYAFLSGGDMHHEIALQALGDDAYPVNPFSIGLYHVAFEVPDAQSFALAYKALQEGGIRVQAVDHRISWAMYFADPDGNGLEIYWDTRHIDTGSDTWTGHSLPLSDGQIFAALEELAQED